MNSLSIKLKVRELSEEFPSKIEKRTRIKLMDSFAEYIKNLYIRSLEDQMYSSRYKGNWEPVEDLGYLEFIGDTPEENILDIIISNIEVKKSLAYHQIRIDPHVRYPKKKSKLTLLRVLNAIEYGTSKFNARPIFRSVISSIDEDIAILWRSYLFRKGVL